MDKPRKIRKYQQKDYSMLVEFPVEIVGRNGVVRTYSFEESIRLYQRRIGTAATRYDDSEVVEAEIGHCRQRIRQLRRSYFERYAWTAIRGLSRREVAGGEMAAEVAAFLARYAGSIDRAERFGISAVESTGSAQIWYLEPPGRAPLLLYLYRFGAGDVCPARAELESFQATLEAARDSEEIEHLHASHVTADCGLLLTGPEAPSLDEDRSEARSNQAFTDLTEPVSQAVAMMRAGQAQEALQLLDSLLILQPSHRGAALTAALAAEYLGSPQQAELYLRLAASYHADDGILLHHLGIALLQQDRLAEAEQALERALEHQPWLFPSRLLLVLLALHGGKVDRAGSLLGQLEAGGGRVQRDAVRAVRAMVRRARWRRGGLVVGALASAVSATWVVLGQPLALPCFAATVAASALLIQLTRRPRPLPIAQQLATKMQVPREMLPPSSSDWDGENENDR